MPGTSGWEDATKGEDVGNLWLIVRLIVVNCYYLWIPHAAFDLPTFCLLIKI